MNIIDLLVYICVGIIIIKYSYIAFSCYDFIFKIPVLGPEGVIAPDKLNFFGFKFLGAASSITTYPLLGIIIIFLILYIIFLIIILVVPDTGIQTFFIPLKELLLSIPPLPELEKAGVFRLFSAIGRALKLNTFIKKLIGINNAFFTFSKDNIEDILKSIFPNVNFDKFISGSNDDDKSIASSNNDDNDNNQDEEEEYKPKPIPKNKQKIYKKIEKEQEICRVNKYKHITPDMTKDEIMATKFKNSSIDSSCSSKTTPKYILS